MGKDDIFGIILLLISFITVILAVKKIHFRSDFREQISNLIRKL